MRNAHLVRLHKRFLMMRSKISIKCDTVVVGGAAAAGDGDGSPVIKTS